MTTSNYCFKSIQICITKISIGSWATNYCYQANQILILSKNCILFGSWTTKYCSKAIRSITQNLNWLVNNELLLSSHSNPHYLENLVFCLDREQKTIVPKWSYQYHKNLNWLVKNKLLLLSSQPNPHFIEKLIFCLDHEQ